LTPRPDALPERRTSWRHRADRALTIVDGSMMVEIELTEADLSLLGTEVQLTMSRASTANGARSVTTERRPAVAVSPLAPVAQTVVWTSVPLTPEIIERLRPLGFRPSWMWWERSQTFVDELCVLPRAPLLALGWVTGPDEYGRLRLRSRAGERLIVATQDIEQLAGNLRSEIRLGVFVCVVFAVFLVGGCLLTALVL
ncbi:hypothetical protein HC891_14110, partial [Candidatus Gracilibacteria bacterium]|nr:hypothetical protein [Candidatus Gracilibacteria bacterium]